jgi:hypothetical protein
VLSPTWARASRRHENPIRELCRRAGIPQLRKPPAPFRFVRECRETIRGSPRGIRDANDNKRPEVPTAEEAVMKTIPLSSIMEFQLKSQKTVRGTGFAESAVWAVFAASSAITVVLSLSQIGPPSVQPSSPNSCSVVWDQQNTQPVYPLQTI